MMEHKGTILLVEDNEDLNESNRRALELKGYRVLTALTLHEAREHLKSCDPDVILLDVMLPDGDGIDFCGGIRGAVTSHVLFLTAKTGDEDKIMGLELGGDDYITKPFRLEEMLARVGAAIRRRRIAPKAAESVTINAGDLSLNTDSLRAYWQGRDLGLQTKDALMLKHLIRLRGAYAAAEDLYREVWGMDAIDVRVVWQSKYRIALCFEKNGVDYAIEHKRGQGYRLVEGAGNGDDE